ncbi:DUF3419 family protein [Fredinandcohnia sp. QZ13]|uniref:DUF3419 family protein n=1 Tax=Fredinandcohnia sp. QZ13 TaxID=3073144 RepID=UPI0028531CC1|nr:DUF3419 family protein [Fredinandcohnia sp. QZ13]MDR4887252.1 DUF3419 family protein [Fredinandcohnia sp. QZ13]
MSKLFFSQIREDNLVEREISKIAKPKKILVIGSGGCTAFSILNDSVDQVICVDINPAQCALIELKKAAINNFPLKEFLAFIGEAPCQNRIQMFEAIANDLPDYAKEYWQQHSQKIEIGINHCGVNERFYRFIGENICRNIYDESVWRELFTAKNLEEQQAFYEKYLTTSEWKIAAKILLSKTTHLQFFPGYMFANASENDFAKFFLRQFEKEVKTKPIHNNYFLSQILFSSYLYKEVEGVPFYLTEDGYEAAKRNIDKLAIHPESIKELLSNEGSIDAFYLSNVFDWADEKGKDLICNGILQAKSAKAIVLFRNMLSTSQLPEDFMKQFICDEELSERCEGLERSMLYQKITVGQCV